MRPPTSDQIRLRAELAAAQEQIVVLLRSAVGDTLSPEQAQAAAEQAQAWRGANAFRLLRYLSGGPDTLSAPVATALPAQCACWPRSPPPDTTTRSRCWPAPTVGASSPSPSRMGRKGACVHAAPAAAARSRAPGAATWPASTRAARMAASAFRAETRSRTPRRPAPTAAGSCSRTGACPTEPACARPAHPRTLRPAAAAAGYAGSTP